MSAHQDDTQLKVLAQHDYIKLNVSAHHDYIKLKVSAHQDDIKLKVSAHLDDIKLRKVAGVYQRSRGQLVEAGGTDSNQQWHRGSPRNNTEG